MTLEKLPEFDKVQQFANRVSPAINIWEEESFEDFTVNPDVLLLSRDASFFIYTDKRDNKVLIQIGNTSIILQVGGICTRSLNNKDLSINL